MLEVFGPFVAKHALGVEHHWHHDDARLPEAHAIIKRHVNAVRMT